MGFRNGGTMGWDNGETTGFVSPGAMGWGSGRTMGFASGGAMGCDSGGAMGVASGGAIGWDNGEMTGVLRGGSIALGNACAGCFGFAAPLACGAEPGAAPSETAGISESKPAIDARATSHRFMAHPFRQGPPVQPGGPASLTGPIKPTQN